MKDQFATLPPEQFTTERIPTFFIYFYLMTRGPLINLPDELSQSTSWTDSVGSKEAITGYDEHLPAVRRKKGASIHILGSEPHARINKRIETVDEIAHLLTSSERRREKPIPTSL